MQRNQIISALRAFNIKFDDKASNRQLTALLNDKVKTVNTAKGKIFVAQNAADETTPAEIMICDEIGKDPWSGEGIGAKDIRAALDAVTPKTRGLNFFTNSPGGLVNEGVAIRNILNEWPGKITNTIIGVAASTASWCIPADETRAYKSSQIFIHRAWGMVVGNADDMKEAITFLETTDGQIADIYAEQSGKSADEMLALMSDETLLTGAQAKELGLVDTLIDGDAASNFNNEHIAAMKNKLAALNSLKLSASPTQGEQKTNNNKQQENQVNKEQKLALLNSWGVKTENGIDDAALDAIIAKGKPVENKADDKIAALENKISELTNANTEAKRIRMGGEVARLISEDRIPEALREDTLTDLMRDEKRLEYYNKLVPKTPGAEPVGVVEITGDSLQDVTNYVLNNGPKFRNQFIGAQNAGKQMTTQVVGEIANRAKLVGSAIQKNLNKILTAWNTNTIDSDLKRQVILQVPLLKAFKKRIVPLQSFSTVFNNIPLEGTDKIEVAYYPLQTAASTDFNGTYSAGNTSVENREVAVTSRKYQMMAFTSQELRRLPYVNWEQLAAQNGDKLGYDVFGAVITNTITAANYGASVKAVPAAAFTADDVADLYGTATGLNWPDNGRALLLNHTYKTALLKDPAFKQYLAYGDTDPIRKAMIQEAYGFENLYTVPNLTTLSPAGENLVGWINHASAVLVATSPIMPTEDVRAVMTRYDVVTDPDTGLSIEYRRWGSPSTDTTNEVVECNFGYGVGVETALARITSA